MTDIKHKFRIFSADACFYTERNSGGRTYEKC